MGTYVLYLKLLGKAVALAAGFLMFVLFWRNLGFDLLDPDNQVSRLLFNPRLSLPVILLAGPALYYVHQYNDKVSGKIDALKGAAFDLVRMMETTTDGTAKKAEILNKIAETFAVDGAAKVATAFSGTATVQAGGGGGSGVPGTPGYTPSHQIILPDLIAFADKLRDGRATDMATIGANTGNLRTGLQVFLMLMRHNNIQSAHTNMTEYMKKQRDGAKTLPNFVELKSFLGLPTRWPEADEPEKLQAAGLSWYEYQACASALKRGRKAVLAIMAYNPPVDEGKAPIVIRGENVLESMRTFLYSAKTYNPALAS